MQSPILSCFMSLLLVSMVGLVHAANFIASCRQAHIDTEGYIFLAWCKKNDGTWAERSGVDLRKCLGNNNGNLGVSPSSRPFRFSIWQSLTSSLHSTYLLITFSCSSIPSKYFLRLFDSSHTHYSIKSIFANLYRSGGYRATCAGCRVPMAHGRTYSCYCLKDDRSVNYSEINLSGFYLLTVPLFYHALIYLFYR